MKKKLDSRILDEIVGAALRSLVGDQGERRR